MNRIGFSITFAWVTTALIFGLSILDRPTLADVRFLPRVLDELPLSVKDPLVPVKGASVAYFNRYALERDFEFLMGKTDDEIKMWILENCAYMSQTQTQFNNAYQSPIPVHEQRAKKTSYRPDRWKRAAILPVQDFNLKDAGLIDIKGIGLSEILNEESVQQKLGSFSRAFEAKNETRLDTLRIEDHANGLASLGEAIAEVIRAEALQRIFNHSNRVDETDYQTVEHYFVIALPFKILRNKGGQDPAGLIGRQAHFGRTTDPSTIPNSLYIDLFGSKQFDSFRAAVDMGGVFPTDPGVRHLFLSPRQIELLETSLKPHRVPLQQIDFDPQDSEVWKKSHDKAWEFMQSPWNHHIVLNYLNSMMGAYEHQDQTPPSIVPRSWTVIFEGNDGYGLVVRQLKALQPWSDTTWKAIQDIFDNNGRRYLLDAFEELDLSLQDQAKIRLLLLNHWSEFDLTNRYSLIKKLGSLDDAFIQKLIPDVFSPHWITRESAIKLLKESHPTTIQLQTELISTLLRAAHPVFFSSSHSAEEAIESLIFLKDPQIDTILFEQILLVFQKAIRSTATPEILPQTVSFLGTLRFYLDQLALPSAAHCATTIQDLISEPTNIPPSSESMLVQVIVRLLQNDITQVKALFPHLQDLNLAIFNRILSVLKQIASPLVRTEVNAILFNQMEANPGTLTPEARALISLLQSDLKTVGKLVTLMTSDKDWLTRKVPSIVLAHGIRSDDTQVIQSLIQYLEAYGALMSDLSRVTLAKINPSDPEIRHKLFGRAIQQLKNNKWDDHGSLLHLIWTLRSGHTPEDLVTLLALAQSRHPDRKFAMVLLTEILETQANPDPAIREPLIQLLKEKLRPPFLYRLRSQSKKWKVEDRIQWARDLLKRLRAEDSI